ncbi:MAG: hypothetical protein Q9183_003756 [Haloplaca sp. 2 TL-2023]
MPSFFYHITFDLQHPTQTAGTSQTIKNSGLETPTTLGKAQPSYASRDQSDSNGDLILNDSTESNPAGSNPKADWRYGQIKVQNIDMQATEPGSKRNSRGELSSHLASGLVAGHGGLPTKGRFEPLNHEEELGWGVIRLFRDSEETPGLYDETTASKQKSGRGSLKRGDGEESRFRDEDCTTLCILAVPSYLTPSDFLGFVGEKTREEVSHFRMIRTERGNRYMVLMKFRSGKTAREWRKEWNGKAFDGMEPENCHVVFVKSIEFRAPDAAAQESFPDMTNDPFTPVVTRTDTQPSITNSAASSALTPASRKSKPMAPPTPSLIELPTCPVCLERMDESTGLLTILCQHVFHCTCLQKWRGSGCPVCRYTQDGLSRRNTTTDGETGLNECNICGSEANLWICLICGTVGCGRYDAAHAFLHYQQTSHCFAMDLSTQRVWDYASDAYVHRLMQDKADGKLMELPASTVDAHETRYHGNAWDTEDYVPREKLDNIGMEYTHLLTSQLESQRLYFAEALERAADKASKAAQAAEKAESAAAKTQEQFSAMQISHKTIAEETIPSLERDADRASKRATKFEAMARKLEKEWREEKAVSGSLMERIKWLEGQVQTLTTEKSDLQEQNRDLSFFISGGDKLKQLNGVDEDEVREGTTTVADPPAAGKGKGKKKAKK